MAINEKLVYYNFSFGISSYPKDGVNLNELLEAADKRMYLHKQNKKSCCEKI